ncbi:sensor histidine kinase [Actinoplanes sp. NPDC051343]|uniref:sensor histidine kinase n=1 Tax=Actinoplanes sp. NPDC051343 TaxID=3363906 RepID=UPI0037ABF728
MTRTWRALAATVTTALAASLLWVVLSVPLTPLVVAVLLVRDRPTDTHLVIAAVLGLVSAGLLVFLGPRLATAVAVVERWRLRLPAASPDPGAWRALTYTLLLVVVAPPWLGVMALAGALVVSTPIAVYHRIATANAIGDVAGRLALGLVLVPVVLGLASVFASGHAAVARRLLGALPDPAEARLVEVTRSRARMADAFDAERMRIERDLHDVAQQRLVSLTMQLGLAKLDLPAGSPAAEALTSALEQGKALMAELRDLVRGISPLTLRELGLRAAVEELAAGSPLRITVDVVAGRFAPGAETVAFAAVSEALANTAKHAATGHAAVAARRSGDLLTVEVRDDGPGGADPSRGTGLTGLADRAAAAGGRLLMSSPPGGPTILRVELPCAS